MNWYFKVSKDLSLLPQCIEYYEKFYEENKPLVLNLNGKNLEKTMANLPGYYAEWSAIQQNLDCIFRYLEVQLDKEKQKKINEYMTKNNRAINQRDAEKLVDCDQDILSYLLMMNDVAYIRSLFTGVLKSLEIQQYMMSNITKLKTSGMEDAVILSH